MNVMLAQDKKYLPVTRTHHDISDISLFELYGSVRKEPLYGFSGQAFSNWYGLVNEHTGEPLNSKPLSTKYKLVPHKDLFARQASTVLDHATLPSKNVTVVDTIYDNGAKAIRNLYFDDLQYDIDGSGLTTARLDIINSYDTSWAFQMFAGAYRDYCRNTQVFGGKASFHVKSKHTDGLNVDTLLDMATVSLSDFERNREQMVDWQNVKTTAGQRHQFFDYFCKKSDGSINKNLRGFLNWQYNKESLELGHNLYALYNTLTHWSSHHRIAWDKINEKGDKVLMNTGKESGNRHTVLAVRQDAVRKALTSPAWDDMQLDLAA